MYINHCSGWHHQTQAVLFNPLTDGSSEAEQVEKARNQLHPQQPGRTVAEPPPWLLPSLALHPEPSGVECGMCDRSPTFICSFIFTLITLKEWFRTCPECSGQGVLLGNSDAVPVQQGT